MMPSEITAGFSELVDDVQCQGCKVLIGGELLGGVAGVVGPVLFRFANTCHRGFEFWRH